MPRPLGTAPCCVMTSRVNGQRVALPLAVSGILWTRKLAVVRFRHGTGWEGDDRPVARKIGGVSHVTVTSIARSEGIRLGMGRPGRKPAQE